MFSMRGHLNMGAGAVHLELFDLSINIACCACKYVVKYVLGKWWAETKGI